MNLENKVDAPTDSDEISLKELIMKLREWKKYLFSKWLIIMICGFIGGGLGFAYSYYKKPVYTATTTFVLEDEKSGGGLSGLAGLASIAGVDLGGSGGGIFQGDNILQLYQSRTMLEKTLLTEIEVNGEKQLLVDRYINFTHLKKKWKENPELSNLQFSDDRTKNGSQVLKPNRLRDSVLGVIVLELNKTYLSVVKPDKKLSTIQVNVRANDEVFAKAFNNELVKNVNEFYVATKTKKTLQNVEILQHKTDSVRSVMNGAIYSAASVSDATPNLNPTRQVQRVAPMQKSQFSAETNKTILAEMVKNLEMTKMALLKETPLIQVVDQPVYPLQVERLGKFKAAVIGVALMIFLSMLFFTIKNMLNKITL